MKNIIETVGEWLNILFILFGFVFIFAAYVGLIIVSLAFIFEVI